MNRTMGFIFQFGGFCCMVYGIAAGDWHYLIGGMFLMTIIALDDTER